MSRPTLPTYRIRTRPAFKEAHRQTTGFVESLLRLAGRDFRTLSRRQTTLAVNIPYRVSKGPLRLLIPFSGHCCALSCRAVDGSRVPTLTNAAV